MMLYRSAYRAGLSREENDLLRKLRGRGFAVAIFSPVDVGNPLNRGSVEQSMLKAGRKTLKQIEVSYAPTNVRR